MPEREVLNLNGTMINQTLIKLKDVHEQGFVTLIYITPNNKIKSARVYKDSSTKYPNDKLYTVEDLLLINNDFGLIFNNDYLFKTDEPIFIVTLYDYLGDIIYMASADYLYSSITDLEKTAMYAYATGYLPEFLEESDYRPANTVMQIKCEYQVVNP